MKKYDIRIAELKDIEVLKSLEQTWENHQLVSGEVLPKNYFENCILEGDLPPIENPSFEQYDLYIVEHNNKPIAFFDLYKGYPTDLSAWISIFVVDKDVRGQGHGKKIISYVEQHIKSSGLTNISIAVDLKNYNGLMFWTKIGFNEIIGVYGDKKYGPDKYAVIGLRKNIE